MRKIKVLYTIPNFDTAGSGKALLHLAKGLSPNYFQVEIMCLHGKGDFFKTVKDSGFPIHILDYLPKERPFITMLSNCWKVSKLVKAIQPDIIHSFNYSSNYTEALVAKMAGIPWVFTKKNMSWGGASKNSWRLRSLLATKIVVQNTNMLVEFYSKSLKTELIPRGVAFEKFKPEVSISQIRDLMGTDLDKRIIICVANLVPVKGIEVLISSFEKLASKFPQWEVWIVGDDSTAYGQLLKQTVLEKQLQQQIKFSGKQLDIKPYLDQAELFVLPTLDKGEGSSVAMLEAMANGKVVLGSNVPGIKDQLAIYPDYLFQAGDPISLQMKLQKLLVLNSDILKQIGEEFQIHARNNFTLAFEIKKHEELYQSIVK